MPEKIAIVTGASSGIGAASTEMLAREGYFVYAAARSMDQLEALRTDVIQPLSLDVTDSNSIHMALQRILRENGRIDVLVNNAGYGGYGMIEGMSMADARRQFDVNVFGAMETIKAVLPTMRRQRSGRVIQLGSIVSHVSVPALGWYAASKHAIKALMDALRLEVKPFGIQVVMIEPGPIASGFLDIALASLEKAEPPEGYDAFVDSYREMLHGEYLGCPGPDNVVALIRKAALVTRPKAAYTDCFRTRIRKQAKHWLSDGWFDFFLEKQLNHR